MYNFNAPLHIINERKRICNACKFYKAEYGTCGTPIIGETVTYYKEKVKLCGCIMSLKTKFRFTSCPAHKWHSYSWSKKEIIELGEFIETLQNRHKLDMTEVAQLAKYMSKITGKKENISTCASCVREMIIEFKRQLGKLTDNDLIVTNPNEFNKQLRELLLQKQADDLIK